MELTQKILKEYLHYNKDTGVFTWIKKTHPSNTLHSIEGVNVIGYINIKIFNISYRAHRLAFLYEYGYIPKEIDHLNHIRNDNRLCNIVATTRQQNMQNKTKYKNNSSGCVGVVYGRGRWNAQINTNKKYIYLGGFKHKEEAILARKHAERLYGFHANHGL